MKKILFTILLAFIGISKSNAQSNAATLEETVEFLNTYSIGAKLYSPNYLHNDLYIDDIYIAKAQSEQIWISFKEISCNKWNEYYKKEIEETTKPGTFYMGSSHIGDIRINDKGSIVITLKKEVVVSRADYYKCEDGFKKNATYSLFCYQPVQNVDPERVLKAWRYLFHLLNIKLVGDKF